MTSTVSLSPTRRRWAWLLDQAASLMIYVGCALLPTLFWPWSNDVFVGPKHLAVRLITAGVAAAAAGALILGRSRVRSRLPDAAAGIFLIVNVVALLLSVDRRTSLLGEPLQQAGVVTLVALGGVYAVTRVTIRSRARLQRMLVAIAIGATIVAGYGLLQAARLDPVWSIVPNDRLFSLVGQPNWLGAYLVLTIPLTLSLVVCYQSLSVRGLVVASVMSQLLVLSGTLSRASWVGLIVSFVAGTVLFVGYRLRGAPSDLNTGFRALAAIGILVLVLGFGIRWLPVVSLSAIADRASSAVDLDAFDVQQHLSLWEVATAIIIDHPLVGTGPDTYAIVFPGYRDQVLEPAYAEYLSSFRPESPHNVYLAYAVGAGLVALAVYMLFVLSVLAVVVRAIWRTQPLSVLLLGVLIGLVGHAVTDAFMTMDVIGSWLFWGIAGAAVTIADLEFKSGDSPSPSESQSVVD